MSRPAMSPRALLLRARSLTDAGRRAVLGITGAPGAGKSTFADALAATLAADPPPGLGPEWVARVPMDGFHLADRELARLGRAPRKGAPDTFDALGFAAMLQRLRADREEVIYAPTFERELDQPVAGSIAVHPETRLVITEGNYLLADGGAWRAVSRHLTEVWYLDLDERERLKRLEARHARFGKPPDLARAWAHGPDQTNATTVLATRQRADLHVPSDILTPAGEPLTGAAL